MKAYFVGPLGRLLSNSAFSHEEGNRTSFQNVAFLKIFDDVQNPTKQHFQAICCAIVKKT
jgi:hypothetical protein